MRFLQNGTVKKLESEGQKQNDGLLDYKFFCFNGTPQYLYVSEKLGCHERAKVSFMTMDYKEAGFSRKDYSSFKVLPSKPVCFEEMKALASKLSKGIPFLRVDFYEVREHAFFGELTFFSGSGFTPYTSSTADLELGKMLLLPEQQ